MMNPIPYHKNAPDDPGWIGLKRTEMTLYQLRLNHLEKLIKLKAPSEIIYFSCETLLLTKYKSRLGVAWFFIKQDAKLRWMDLTIWFEFKYLCLRYGKDKAIEKLTT